MQVELAAARAEYAAACRIPQVAACDWWAWHSDGRPIGPVRLPQLLYLCRGAVSPALAKSASSGVCDNHIMIVPAHAKLAISDFYWVEIRTRGSLTGRVCSLIGWDGGQFAEAD